MFMQAAVSLLGKEKLHSETVIENFLSNGGANPIDKPFYFATQTDLEDLLL